MTENRLSDRWSSRGCGWLAEVIRTDDVLRQRLRPCPAGAANQAAITGGRWSVWGGGNADDRTPRARREVQWDDPYERERRFLEERSARLRPKGAGAATGEPSSPDAAQLDQEPERRLPPKFRRRLVEQYRSRQRAEAEKRRAARPVRAADQEEVAPAIAPATAPMAPATCPPCLRDYVSDTPILQTGPDTPLGQEQLNVDESSLYGFGERAHTTYSSLTVILKDHESLRVVGWSSASVCGLRLIRSLAPHQYQRRIPAHSNGWEVRAHDAMPLVQLMRMPHR